MTTSRLRPRLRRPVAATAAAALSIGLLGAASAQSASGAEPPAVVVEDFESGLPSGADGDGVAIGFSTFQGAGSTVAVSTEPAPEPVPGGHALRMDVDVTSYAGVVQAFADDDLTTWVSQDWSASKGFTMRLYGQGSGTTLFVDVLENRNPGSTTDDAERWSADVVDDFTGWREIEIPFSALVRKGVGNNAPDDGFEGVEVHGWALGALGTGGPRTYWVDDVGTYGVAEIPELAVGFAARNLDVPEGETGDVRVRLNRTLRDGDPDAVTVAYVTEPGTAARDRDYTPATGTLTFTRGGPRELTFPLETLDNGKDDGDRRVILRLRDPAGAAAAIMQAAGTIVDDEPFDPLLVDDLEQGAGLWDASDAVVLDAPEVAAGDPGARPGQGAWEQVLAATSDVPIVVDVAVTGRRCGPARGVVAVALLSTATFDATTIDHSTVRVGDARETLVDRSTGVPRRHVLDVDRDGRKDLVVIVRRGDIGVDCHRPLPVTGETTDGRAISHQPVDVRFGRDFPQGVDWSGAAGLSFWYQGRGTGEPVIVELLDDRAPDPGPDGWDLVWSDEFDEPAGTPPNPESWGYEIGDGTVNGIPGWGNSELQYYTDSPENAATDGEGSLVISARESEGLQCYYGECDYTSARLLSKHRAEFAYGRIESRIQVPDGEAGLWPAFWSLGTDIDRVGWPQTGEIDLMEYVSRIPDEVFGTVHGPGYAGGDAFGSIVNLPDGIPGAFHTYAVEWQPDRIEWYLDGRLFHTATPADVAPNAWVFNDPVFLLLNMAIGGSFGGTVSPDLTVPQEMKVDYVRVYQGPDTAERFEATFVDDSTGWRQVTVPFGDFVRRAEQPDGAPDDGLGLEEVWGYGFRPPGGSGTVRLDQVHLVDSTPPEVTVVDNVAGEVANGNVIFTFRFSEDVGTSFDASDVELAGGTKGTVTRVSGTEITLVARPPADSTGVLAVSVAPGSFEDLSGNANVVGASAEQAFETPPADGLTLTFSEDPPPVLTGFGGASGSVVTDPTDAAGTVAQIVKGGPEVWAGVVVSTGESFSVPEIPFSDADATITLRLWSPKPAGTPVLLKVENAADAGQFAEVTALTTVQEGWQTLSFDFTGVADLTRTYDKVAVFPDFGTAGTGETYYLDDLTFP